MFRIGCHVSVAGGVCNAPKNAHSLGCEVFQIFTRPPMGGKAPELTKDIIAKFQEEVSRYGYSYRYDSDGNPFVVHTPYYINFGSSQPRIFYGSISVVRQELDRASLLGAKYAMTHLGSFKDLGQKEGIKQVKQGLKEVLKGYKGKTEFLLEIAAGSGQIIGDTFEELAEIMEPLKKIKGFGGICFDTQHAFASGYDLRDNAAVASTFAKFDKVIGLKWLKMSHINDSKPDLGEKKDRHDHIGEGKIGQKGFEAILGFLNKLATSSSIPSQTWRGRIHKVADASMLLILETEHDKVKQDIKILKSIRDKNYPALSS